jgi:predicted choloylglycine hydrolase
MLHFKGSYNDIGRQIGEYYKSHKCAFPAVGDAGLLRQQIAFHEKFVPEIIEEIRGIAQGGQYDFESVAFGNLVGEILFLRKRGMRACSIGGVVANGKTWIGRNYDWHPAVANQYQLYRLSPTNAEDTYAVSDMCVMDETCVDKSRQFFYHEDAINESGLFIGMTFAHSWDTQIGLKSADVVRLVAWRCRSVAEAVAFFEKMPRCGAKNYFVADRQGKMAAIQCTAKEFDVRYPDENGLLVLTNHYVGKLKNFDRVLESNPHHTTFDRYTRLYGDLLKMKTEKADPLSGLDAIFTGKSTPVCQSIPGVETVWTLLMNMGDSDYTLIGDPRRSRRIQNISFSRPAALSATA